MDKHIEVFLVEHMHVVDGEESIKTIGIYSSRAAAEEAVERLRLQPGFRDTPQGFTIDPYWLDQDSWQEGYVTLSGSRADEPGNDQG